MITPFQVPNDAAKKICLSWRKYEDAVFEWLNKSNKASLEQALDIRLEALCRAIQTYSRDAKIDEILKEQYQPLSFFVDNADSVRLESKIAANAGRRPQKNLELIEKLGRVQVQGNRPKSTGDVIKQLRDDHEEIKHLGKAAFNAKRRESKALKKKVVLCLSYTSLGIGTLVCNSFFPPSQAFSYSLGTAALLTASSSLH